MNTDNTGMDRDTARNILNSRAIIKDECTTKNVAITNVSFTDADGEVWKWDEESEGSSAGEPYAIVNFNACNPFGLKKAKELARAGEYQDACNNNLTLRVTPELGQELKESMFATVVTRLREIEDPDDEDKTVMALFITKAVPNIAKTIERANFDDIFEDEDGEGIRTEEERLEAERIATGTGD